ncbi:hypothetical protein SAMD00079811_29880 [Scytonema sp. HK-05]|nr:hypothetical protein SAMD00079811_29880 [Scytonema sp. HK-05]
MWLRDLFGISLRLALTILDTVLHVQEVFTQPMNYIPNKVRKAQSCAAGICP